ncbi:MAG: M50 family metallopeptidase [Thermoanaerobaculia bacterium]|nr:M50 family metallopeptidase [Thermoanaerobaculia bacterium]
MQAPLLPVAGAALAAALLAVVPWLSPVAYPLRLLLTVVHELGHGLAALATGGRFSHFAVFADGSGVAYTAGGWRLIVVPAGYLGAALFSAALVALAARRRRARWLLGGLGAAVGALSLRYALPALFSAQAGGGLLALLTGAGLGAVFLWIAARAPSVWILFTLHLVAFWGCLGALADLWALAGLSRLPARGTDAHTMAELALLPPLFWALAWGAIALLLMAAALYRTWLAPTASEASYSTRPE